MEIIKMNQIPIEKHLKFIEEFYIQIFNPTDIDFVHETLNEDLT